MGWEMSEAIFTGKFLKPVEAFALQPLDHTDLNRLGLEVFLGIIVLAGIALVIHFVLQRFPNLIRKKERR